MTRCLRPVRQIRGHSLAESDGDRGTAHLVVSLKDARRYWACARTSWPGVRMSKIPHTKLRRPSVHFITFCDGYTLHHAAAATVAQCRAARDVA